MVQETELGGGGPRRSQAWKVTGVFQPMGAAYPVGDADYGSSGPTLVNVGGTDMVLSGERARTCTRVSAWVPGVQCMAVACAAHELCAAMPCLLSLCVPLGQACATCCLMHHVPMLADAPRP